MNTFYYRLAKQQCKKGKILCSELIYESVDTKNLHIHLLNDGCKIPVTLAHFRSNIRSEFKDAIEMDWDDASLEYIVNVKRDNISNILTRYLITPV